MYKLVYITSSLLAGNLKRYLQANEGEDTIDNCPPEERKNVPPGSWDDRGHRCNNIISRNTSNCPCKPNSGEEGLNNALELAAKTRLSQS
jgi:hypothetical protein